MTLRQIVQSIAANERLNFWLTNRIPRRMFTLMFGWFSKLTCPIVSVPSIALWRLFSDVDLSEAKKPEFASLHDCFIRELKPGSRPAASDRDIACSPCDAIVGTCGTIESGTVIQAKGSPYSLADLLRQPALVDLYKNGTFATLRLTATMYHRFHAPHDCTVDRVSYISGDSWNVNPSALRRVRQLFCKNERAVIPCRLPESGITLTLVPVAAILVASIRLHFLDVLLHLRYRGPSLIRCTAALGKGEEMGWFQHGSTIIVFAPMGVSLHEAVHCGAKVKAGQPLLRLNCSPLLPLACGGGAAVERDDRENRHQQYDKGG